MDIREELLKVIDALNMDGVEYALCGGLAVVVHGYLRLTDDIDLLVTPASIRKAEAAAKQAGFRISTPEPIVFNRGKSNETVVHRISKFHGEDHLILDLIEVSPNLRQVWNDRQCLRWEGRDLWVVSAAGLAYMKRGTGRKQDAADLENLGFSDG